MKNKLHIFLVIISMAFFLSSAPAQAMGWGFNVSDIKLMPIDTTPIEYPLYINVVNEFGTPIPCNDGFQPNAWIISNRNIMTYGQMAAQWMENTEVNKKYKLLLVVTTQVKLPYVWKTTPDEATMKEFTAIVITLEKIKEVQETHETETVNTEQKQEQTIFPVAVQLPETGQAQGIIAGSAVLILVGLLARRIQ